MKVVERRDIFARGSFPKSQGWAKACRDVDEAIRVTDWPHGSGTFTIFPERAKHGKPGNGVVPIKFPCINNLVDRGWQAENLPVIVEGVLGTGDLDALYTTDVGNVAFE